MTVTGAALRLSIFVGESDQYHHRPVYTEIVHRAHREGLAGATVLHGIEGYGAHSRIHTTRLLSLTGDLPVVVVIVDTEPKIRAFLSRLTDLIGDALAVVEPVEVVGRARGLLEAS